MYSHRSPGLPYIYSRVIPTRASPAPVGHSSPCIPIGRPGFRISTAGSLPLVAVLDRFKGVVPSNSVAFKWRRPYPQFCGFYLCFIFKAVEYSLRSLTSHDDFSVECFYLCAFLSGPACAQYFLQYSLRSLTSHDDFSVECFYLCAFLSGPACAQYFLQYYPIGWWTPRFYIF